MAGIINKIGDALHIGGNKDGEKKHEGDHKKHDGESKSSDHKPEHKEGIIDKVKDKIHGGSKEHCGEGEKKNKKNKKKDKKDKKNKKDDDGSSSSSSSDSD